LTLENPEAIYLYLVSRGTKIQEPSLHYIMNTEMMALSSFSDGQMSRSFSNEARFRTKKGEANHLQTQK